MLKGPHKSIQIICFYSMSKQTEKNQPTNVRFPDSIILHFLPVPFALILHLDNHFFRLQFVFPFLVLRSTHLHLKWIHNYSDSNFSVGFRSYEQVLTSWLTEDKKMEKTLKLFQE